MQSHDNQTEYQEATDAVGYNLEPILQISDLEELNYYHHFHRKGVIRTYGG